MYTSITSRTVVYTIHTKVMPACLVSVVRPQFDIHKHILNAKSSRDAFVAQRHEGHFCGCVMHGRATQGSCIAQDGAFGGRAVGGAPGAIFIYGAPLALRTPYDCDKIPGRVFGRDQITCAELFCGWVYGQAASSS